MLLKKQKQLYFGHLPFLFTGYSVGLDGTSAMPVREVIRKGRNVHSPINICVLSSLEMSLSY